MFLRDALLTQCLRERLYFSAACKQTEISHRFFDQDIKGFFVLAVGCNDDEVFFLDIQFFNSRAESLGMNQRSACWKQ